MGLFNPKVQDIGDSSVTVKAAPQKPNIAGEVANVIGTSASIFAKVGAAKQGGVNNSVVAEFNQELVRIAEGVNQGGSRTAAATASRTKYTQFVSQYPQLAGEFSKAYKGVNDTTDAFEVEKSEAEVIREKGVGLATAQGFVTADMSDAEVNKGLEDFAGWKMAQNKLSSLKANQEYNNAKTNEERKAATESRKVTSDKATQEYVDSRGGGLSTSMVSTYSKVTSGELEPSDGLLELQGLISNFRLEVTNSGTESKELANSLLQGYEGMAQTYQDMIKSPADVPYYEGKVKAQQAKVKTLLLADPELSAIVGLSNLVGNTISTLPVLETITSRVLGQALNKGTNGTGKTPIIVGEKGGDGYIDVIKKSTKVLTAKGTPEDMQPAITEVGIHVSQLLKSIDVYATAVERPEEYNKVVDFIASPDMAQVVNAGLIEPEAATNAKEVLLRDYTSVLLPLVQEKIKTTFVTRGYRHRAGAVNKKEFVVEDIVDIDVGVNGVTFRAKEGLLIDKTRKSNYVGLIRDLNSSVGKQMNKVIRMDAHLSGSTDYKSVATASLAGLFGYEVQAKGAEPKAKEPKK